MPPILKKKTLLVKPAIKTTPIVNKPIVPERPCLRVFECLVHVEACIRNLDMVSIYTGPDKELMHKTRTEAAACLLELQDLYKKYWKELNR